MNLDTNKPVRVVRIIDRLNVGGPTKHVTWLTAGLGRRGYQTTLVTGTVPPGEGDMSYFARKEGVAPIVIDEMSRELSPRDLLVIGRLVRLFWKVRPQIIHTHKAKAGAVGRTAALVYKWLTPSALLLRPRPCKVIHTYHGHVFHSYFGKTKTRMFLTIERILARFCTDRIITVSDQQRREIHERFKVGRRARAREQFRVVPLGIDLEETSPKSGGLRCELGISDDAFVIGAVGRLCEVKNYAMLLRATAKLLSDRSDARSVHLIIVGDGHLRSDLENLAGELGIRNSVSFTGLRDDAPSLYGDFDLVALTSLNEGTPLTLIEGMTCGRPVVATAVGGVVDLLGARQSEADGFQIWEHGATCRSEDADAFARAMRHLIDRPDLRSEMGARARTWSTEHYSKERLVADVDCLYRDAIGTASVAQVQPGADNPVYALPLPTKQNQSSSTN
ncbi:MAG TPA: glycosyltransferase [Blastocatellia bacterium]|nr:glycosyltransferase [Blastocatellia bacterium]